MKILIRFFQGILALILCGLLAVNGWALVQLEIMERPMPEFHGVSLLQVEFDTMKPALFPGDMALAVKQSHYTLGDAVVIGSPEGRLTVTRLVGSVNDLWITKSDSAAEDDPDLLADGEILGSVQTTIPYLGDAAKFLWSVPGLITVLAAGVILLKLPGWLLRPGKPARERPEKEKSEKAQSKYVARHSHK